MISIETLRKTATCCHLLEPPAPEVITELLEEIHRLHSKLTYIYENATEKTIKELAYEPMYDKD